MAVQGPIPVDFAHAFPRGAYAGGAFEPVRDFDASKDGRFVQPKDKIKRDAIGGPRNGSPGES
jgi:hypothetical protein